jgi:hypothetical protein
MTSKSFSFCHYPCLCDASLTNFFSNVSFRLVIPVKSQRKLYILGLLSWINIRGLCGFWSWGGLGFLHPKREKYAEIYFCQEGVLNMGLMNFRIFNPSKRSHISLFWININVILNCRACRKRKRIQMVLFQNKHKMTSYVNSDSVEEFLGVEC